MHLLAWLCALRLSWNVVLAEDPSDPAIPLNVDYFNVSSGEPLPNELCEGKQVTIMFLTTDRFFTEDYWIDWFEDAEKWIASQPCLKGRALANGVLYRADTKKPNLSSKAAKYVRPLPNPYPCKRAFVLKCEYELLKGAYDANPEGYFVISSSTNIPIKRFADLFVYMNQSPPRSLIDYVSVGGFEGSQKHQEWMILLDKHAKALIDHPELWVDKDYEYYRKDGGHDGAVYASGDEYRVGWALKEIFGAEELAKEVNDLRPPPSRRVFGYNASTFTWWGPSEEMGIAEDPSYAPYTWDVIWGDTIRNLVFGCPGTFFARKFHVTAKVGERKDNGEAGFSAEDKMPLRKWLQDALYHN